MPEEVDGRVPFSLRELLEWSETAEPRRYDYPDGSYTEILLYVGKDGREHRLVANVIPGTEVFWRNMKEEATRAYIDQMASELQHNSTER